LIVFGFAPLDVIAGAPQMVSHGALCDAQFLGDSLKGAQLEVQVVDVGGADTMSFEDGWSSALSLLH
jgi:hypothetical protein